MKKKLNLDLEVRKLTKAIIKGEYGTRECHSRRPTDVGCTCPGKWTA